ncbi:MAG: twin-arginine translocase TatA/TatE family subunit [Actinobacteria bacterium]|nr:twin-arginine translocase TatA/TatE family subunit [Actinomycetota bacterium]MBA3566575.1 twin-arginine translocase TatA/TatE family subunit [Actinomycetota bacterium]MDQ3425092.1 twin-arginine translocase TatA/TatE family subunit [Actinomycetota bacterium]
MPFAWWELVLILLVLLLVFGAKRLPEMGRSLGKGMREFKDSVSGLDDRDDRETIHPPAELPAASSDPATPAEPHGIPAEETERERVS